MYGIQANIIFIIHEQVGVTPIIEKNVKNRFEVVWILLEKFIQCTNEGKSNNIESC